MAILTKFFGDLMNHITREYAGKKNKMISECFTIKNHGYTYVYFYGIQSLPQVALSLSQNPEFC